MRVAFFGGRAKHFKASHATHEARGLTIGFEGAGHDFDLYFYDHLPALADRIGTYDLLVTPRIRFAQTGIPDGFEDIPVCLTIGGFGPPNPTENGVPETFEWADSVAFLDPHYAMYHADVLPNFEIEDGYFVPQPPHFDAFRPRDPAPAGAAVLASKATINWSMTTLNIEPETLFQVVAEMTPSVRYETHVKEMEKTPDLPVNVDVLPPVPWTAMPQRYADTSFVFYPVESGCLSSVAEEAMASERAYVVARNHRYEWSLLAYPTGRVDPGDYGCRVDWWMDEYGPAPDPEEIDHMVVGESVDELATEITRFTTGTVERDAVAAAGREWVEAAFAGYGWVDRAEALIDVTPV